MEIVGFLIYPFLACVMLIAIHTYFGVHMLERGIIFVDLSLAQFIGLGIALSFLMGYGDGSEGYLFSIGFAVLGAAILSLSRYIAKVTNIEAFIGVLYIFSLSASMLVLSRSPHGLEEFKAMLSGNILWLGGKDIIYSFVLYFIIGVVHYVFRKRFLAVTREGKGGFLWEFLFFLSFAFVLVSSVKLGGILLVFAMLVIPALIGRLYTKRPAFVLLRGWLVGVAASVFGLGVSYRLDLPSSPLIILFLSVVFFVLLAVKGYKSRATL
jgi:zinc/manganese transport system permease protein